MDAQSNSSVLKTPRLCSCCQIWKDISEFYKYPKSRKERGDGFMRRCKICVREYNRKQQAKPEQKRENMGKQVTVQIWNNKRRIFKSSKETEKQMRYM